MKVFKKHRQSIIPRPFGAAGKLHLSVGVLVFFPLDDPDSPLTEQELWKTVPPLLGPSPVLDQGLPKPRGEVLVTGDCFAPGGKPVRALDVSLGAGPVRKNLNVFGDRYWRSGTISDPEPFTRMPLTWNRAFGGPGFKMNPLGRGAETVSSPDGSKIRPLPNVEDPNNLVGSPDDAPEPAGFAPLDMMWPQRHKKCGTYDDNWLKQRWPWFPDDLNWEFFNTAPEDQFLPDFFNGGEDVEITNMHPEHSVIRTRVPALRMRVFATLNPEFKHHVFPSFPLPSQRMAEHEEFREIKTRLETLWLFPNILRGVAVFRGATEIRDEDYEDAVRLFVAQESLSDEPKPLEHYLEEQKRLLDRGVEIDMAPFEKAAAAYAKGRRMIGNIPKQIDALRKSALGKSPVMPAREPEEMLERALRDIASQREALDASESSARDLMRRLGPAGSFDMGVFTRMRGELDKMESNARSNLARLGETKKNLRAKEKSVRQEMSGRLDSINARLASRPETAHVRLPDMPDAKEDKPPAHERGFPLAVRWRRILEDEDEPRAAVKKLGFETETIKEHWLGFNPEKVAVDPDEWGAGPGEAELPAGFVLPRFDEKTLTGLTIRPWSPGADPGDLMTAERDVCAPGSDRTPLFLPASTLIDLPGMPAAESAPVVRVADDFQALYLEQEVGDFCSVVSLPDPDRKPDDETAKRLETAAPAVIILPASADPDKETEAWRKLMPSAAPLKLVHGGSVFLDAAKGEDIRSRVLQLLPPETAAEHDTSIDLPEAGKPPSPDFMKNFKLPIPDLSAVVPGVISEVRAAHEAPLNEIRNRAMEDLRKTAAKSRGRIKPEDLDFKTPEQSSSPAEKVRDMAKQIRKSAAGIKDRGRSTPEMEENFEKHARFAEDMADFAEQKQAELDDKQKQLNAGLEQLKAGKPPDMDVDTEKYASLTREQVAKRYAEGRSLAGAGLAGLDLSDMDLSGADFTECRLAGTVFTGASLDGATFSRVLAGKADFSGASLKKAVLESGVFNEAAFTGADLNGAECARALFSKADLTGADLRDANLSMCNMTGAVVDKAVFSGASFDLSLLPGSAKEADFRGASLSRCVFKDTVLDGANFSGAKLDRTLFQGAKGAGLDFTGADLERMRSMKNSELPGADFTGSNLRGAGLRDTDLTEAKFTRCELGEALIEKCRLVRADFYHAVAVKARISKCDLEGANLRGVNLFMGSLRKSRLVSADLTGANLYAADFYKAVVGKTLFDGANLKKSLLEKRTGLLEDKS
jgi:uncharacterized protein YjbI with pentapeptide repeats